MAIGMQVKRLAKSVGVCLMAWAVILLTGCISAPVNVERARATTLVAHQGSSLVRASASLQLKPGVSAVRPLPEAAHALDARIALMRQADTSLDVQTYLLGDDGTGRLIVRELLSAARRGVRVRV